MKFKIIKFIKVLIVPIICICCFLGVSSLNVGASTIDKEFHEFEIGQTFPVGYELTSDNSNGITSSKLYVFDSLGVGAGEGYTFSLFIYFNNNNQFVFSVSDGNYEIVPESLTEVFVFADYALPIDSPWELVRIETETGSGELGIYTDVVPIEPEENYIYNGIYNLLGNMIYGTTENLDSSAVGTLTFFSTLITLLCVLLPFIILIFIVRKLCN